MSLPGHIEPPTGAPSPHWRTIRRGATIAGIAAIATALLADLASAGGTAGLGTGQWLLLAFGTACLAIAALGHRTPSAYRATAIVMLNTLVLLTALEIAATGMLIVSNRRRPAESAVENSPIARARWYAGRDWTERFLAEFYRAEHQPRYMPFTLSRTAPFSGRFVNIDQNGYRFTPGADCQPGAYRILVFGGSAVWGWGVVDSATIPAFLQRSWPAHGRSLCVQNLGQNAHVSTQEVIELLRQLQHGNKPDVAIFYDGHNDVQSAEEQGIAGVHYRVDRTARNFEDQSDARPASATELVTRTATFRLLRNLVAERDVSADVTDDVAEARSSADVERLADDVLRAYQTNYRMVAALARDFGFSFAFFWQPELPASAKSRTPEEQRFASDESSYLPLFRAVRMRLEKELPSMPGTYDLSHVFDNETDQIFIDPVHVTPDGNAIIARSIIERLVVKSAQDRS
jgi:lysophospholipase L1-like esterase